jgi:hypothetical protein
MPPPLVIKCARCKDGKKMDTIPEEASEKGRREKLNIPFQA